ncbi:class I SAM-dependent methyltransferase [Opitutales bacterium]|nr:class I SAM-dependent methyltransferase [Opitutales bacterium]
MHSADVTQEHSINFSVGGKDFFLPAGQTYQFRKPQNYYRDTSKDDLYSVINEIKEGTDWHTVVKRKFANSQPWLHDIITSPKRRKFIDEFIKPNNLSVLDIGAGWGQFSIPLAKCNRVCAIEPTPERLEFIRAISEQENVKNNMFFLGSDYLEVEFKKKFDLILSIGVIEWVGSFVDLPSPEYAQTEFLKKAQSELKENGKLIIGIENRLGLKYLMGARDDHHGFEDVMIYGKEFAKNFFGEDYVDARKCLVHSLSDYKELLKKAGFQKTNFFVSVPDYKIIEKIFPITDIGSPFNDFLLKDNWIIEHDGIDGTPLPNQEKLKYLYKSLAKMNIAHLFAPSFMIEAS